MFSISPNYNPVTDSEASIDAKILHIQNPYTTAVETSQIRLQVSESTFLHFPRPQQVHCSGAYNRLKPPSVLQNINPKNVTKKFLALSKSRNQIYTNVSNHKCLFHSFPIAIRQKHLICCPPSNLTHPLCHNPALNALCRNAKRHPASHP
jgi:hypothetical protein